MPKTDLTPGEIRAYRRLALAAREVERLEILRRKRTTRGLIESSNGKLMRGDDPRLTQRELFRHA